VLARNTHSYASKPERSPRTPLTSNHRLLWTCAGGGTLSAWHLQSSKGLLSFTLALSTGHLLLRKAAWVLRTLTCSAPHAVRHALMTNFGMPLTRNTESAHRTLPCRMDVDLCKVPPAPGSCLRPSWRTKDSGGRYYSRPCEGLEGSGTFLGVVGAVTRLDGLHIHTHCASDEAASGESEGGEGGPRREGPEGVHGSLTGAVLWHAWKGPRVLCQAFRLFKEGKGQAFAALPVLFSHA